MSSHHIVRDDQEPALIIANGAACSDELLGQLLTKDCNLQQNFTH